MKTCSQCKKVKPLNAFYPRKRGGVDSQCKECKKANAIAYHYANREKLLARMKDRHAANRDTELSAMRIRNNSDEYRAKSLEWYTKHRDQAVDRMRLEREAMPDYYLKWLICQGSHLKPKDIPQGLIKVKREQLRILRELKKENYEEC